MIKKPERKISASDLKDINDSFDTSKTSQAIVKGRRNAHVGAGVKQQSLTKHTIQSFSGRILRHNKSLIPIGGTQLLIGKKGQSFDSIPVEERQRIAWLESDFE